ncbi:MAG: protein kinase [Verrucomicrobia bacterium]|nr:protein kinase [Verrucomicrobiota bacterium]MBS0636938.1 protein kinase [Verrucomicrobiota bacterium]
MMDKLRDFFEESFSRWSEPSSSPKSPTKAKETILNIFAKINPAWGERQNFVQKINRAKKAETLDVALQRIGIQKAGGGKEKSSNQLAREAIEQGIAEQLNYQLDKEEAKKIQLHAMKSILKNVSDEALRKAIDHIDSRQDISLFVDDQIALEYITHQGRQELLIVAKGAETAATGVEKEYRFHGALYAGANPVGKIEMQRVQLQVVSQMQSVQMQETKADNKNTPQLPPFPPILREARLMQSLQDQGVPHIPTVYSKTTQAMFVEPFDNDLEMELKKEIPAEKREKLFQQAGVILLEFLAALHQNGFIHRDIKPANMLVRHNAEGEIEKFAITDFGTTTNKEMIGDTKVTPAYRPPEWIKEQPFTSKADIWSAGIMLFKLRYNTLLGAKPQLTLNADLTDAMVKEAYQKAMPQNKELDHLDELILKMLRVDPNERISAEEARKLLQKS